MFKKVMTVKDFHKAIKAYGWTIKKGGIDWNVYDENGRFQCAVKPKHPPGKEMTLSSVQRTVKKLKEAGKL